MEIHSIGIAANGIERENPFGDVARHSSTKFPQTPDTHATLSTNGPAVDAFVARAMEPSATRQAKVEELKAAVNEGTYSVDAQKTASAMAKELAG